MLGVYCLVSILSFVAMAFMNGSRIWSLYRPWEFTGVYRFSFVWITIFTLLFMLIRFFHDSSGHDYFDGNWVAYWV